jgi:hypothetical protein
MKSYTYPDIVYMFARDAGEELRIVMRWADEVEVPRSMVLGS